MTREGGAMSIVAVCGTLVLCLSALAVADLGSMVVARTRAQAAADAAALAAAVALAPALAGGETPEQAARAVAEANGASLDSCDCPVGTPDAIVTVSVAAPIAYVTPWSGRRAHATARASIDADLLSYRV